VGTRALSAPISKLWAEFNQDAKALLPAAGFDLLFHQLLALLEKYTLFIPSAAYRERPDIPLFHHLKATAALAACLYDLSKEEQELDGLLTELKPGQKKTPALDTADFLLVAADISGIQDFIYSITSDKALKGLKGRSLFLELLAREWRNKSCKS
jgi:CRISPR-associated protein Csm1